MVRGSWWSLGFVLSWCLKGSLLSPTRHRRSSTLPNVSTKNSRQVVETPMSGATSVPTCAEEPRTAPRRFHAEKPNHQVLGWKRRIKKFTCTAPRSEHGACEETVGATRGNEQQRDAWLPFRSSTSKVPRDLSQLPS